MAPRHLPLTARRPRRGSRVRAYSPAPVPAAPLLPVDVLHAVLDGLRRMDVA